MKILGNSWPLAFATYTHDGNIKTDDLAVALEAARKMAPEAEPCEKVQRIVSPCDLLDPTAPFQVRTVLDSAGNTWAMVGVSVVTNAPSASLVEAEFRRSILAAIGPDWGKSKKSLIKYHRLKAKATQTKRTPYRLTEVGALAVCLLTGEVVMLGGGAAVLAHDLCGRIPSLQSLTLTGKADAGKAALYGILRRQDQGTVPWPTGTAALSRVRSDSKETCAVKLLSWVEGSEDALALISQGWRPDRIEVQWANGRGNIDRTLRLCSITWPSKLDGDDLMSQIEERFALMLDRDREVRALVVDVLVGASFFADDPHEETDEEKAARKEEEKAKRDEERAKREEERKREREEKAAQREKAKRKERIQEVDEGGLLDG